MNNNKNKNNISILECENLDNEMHMDEISELMYDDSLDNAIDNNQLQY